MQNALMGVLGTDGLPLFGTPPIVPPNSAQSAPVARSAPMQPAAPMPPAQQGWKNGLGGIADSFLQGFAPEQHKAGQEKRQHNALAAAMKAGDYQSAASTMYDMGNYQGGMELTQYGDQQAQAKTQKVDAEKAQKLQGLAAMTQHMLNLNEAERGQWAMDNWQQLEPIVGMDFMTFWQKSGGDVSNKSLQEDLAAIQTALGQGPAQPEAYTLAPGAARYQGDQMVANNPVAEKPRSPMSGIGKLASDFEAGLITQEQFDAEYSRMSAPKSPLVNLSMGQPMRSLAEIPDGQPVPVDLLGGIKPDSGFVAIRDSNAVGGFRLEPIEGGKIGRSDANRQTRAERAGGTVVQDIGRALELQAKPGLEGDLATGPIAGLTKSIPGTPADRVNKLVQSALSNIGIDQLQAMRDASPTGGALGQIPVEQQKRLEAMLGSLDVQQIDEDWVNNAKRAQNLYLDMIHGPDGGPPRHDLGFDYLGRSMGPRPDGVTTEQWFNMDPEERELFK